MFLNKHKRGTIDIKLQSLMNFKCCSRETEKEKYIYPVNAIGFLENKQGFIFTAGADGSINFWNYEVKFIFINYKIKNIFY